MANKITGIAQDFGEAYRLLVAALDCFELHLEENKADRKALGNCGNTLLALGELKVRTGTVCAYPYRNGFLARWKWHVSSLGFFIFVCAQSQLPFVLIRCEWQIVCPECKEIVLAETLRHNSS